ncbi:MAG: bleomycin resistance family protein [Bacilli bacterium]|jgi:uncharacterized glyoxalase superfamily protein PhnB|nr:bleomycin resistance family protein [Bacilli bacterium]
MYQTITTNLMVENVKETIHFYQTVLGFTVVDQVPKTDEELVFAIIKKDEIMLMLQEKQSLMEEYPTLVADTIKPSFTLFITVKDVKQLYEQLKDTVTIAKDLHQTFYGTNEFAIFDNNQYILTISQ